MQVIKPDVCEGIPVTTSPVTPKDTQNAESPDLIIEAQFDGQEDDACSILESGMKTVHLGTTVKGNFFFLFTAYVTFKNIFEHFVILFVVEIFR